MSNVQIRHSTEADIPAIVDLYKQKSVYANTLQHPYPNLTYWTRRLTNLPEGNYSLVAEVDGRIVGQLSMEVCTRPRRKHVANLGMGVCESTRRKGVGKALLKAALELAHNWLAVTRVELEVYTDNHAGINLYESCGFVIEGQMKHYAFRDGAYIDAYLMAYMAS